MRYALMATAVLLTTAGGPALASYEAGMAALERHDVTTAAREFRTSAEAGDAPSQYRLGLLYYVGWGVERDYGTAADWLARASRQNHHRAQYILAGLYATGNGVERDYDMARRLYRAASDGVRDATRLSALASANGIDRLLEAEARQRSQNPQNREEEQQRRGGRSGS